MKMVDNNHRASFAKKAILRLLGEIRFGAIELGDGDKVLVFDGKQGENGPKAQLNIRHPQAYKKILLGGSVGAGKSYIDGDWDTNDLQALIGIFLKNETLFKQVETRFARSIGLIRTAFYKLKLNTIRRARDNILAHYDLGNDFFRLILDPSMMYSCAYYDPLGISLELAAQRKLQQICSKMALRSSDHILEIGSGWGGFAIYAAQKYGCKITTTTISDKQYAYVQDKILTLGLTNQIELLKQDYRKLSGQYDKVVSIEMLEAVGHKFVDTFFHQCNQRLKPGGLFFLQSIVINDQSYEKAKNEVDFIKRYIFPGGCLPSVYSIAQSIATQTTLQLLHFEDIGHHYVTTLNDWLQKLLMAQTTIIAQGFKPEFIRMWQFYLCYSAAGFESHYISTIHALWRKRS